VAGVRACKSALTLTLLAAARVLLTRARMTLNNATLEPLANLALVRRTRHKVTPVNGSNRLFSGIPGDPCAWCSTTNTCIDVNFQGDQCPDTNNRVMDSQKCRKYCKNRSGSGCKPVRILIRYIIDVPFAGGAFVGGMFLVIGVLVLGAVGYFVWIRFRGRRASYSVVNN
jgi:hypothetical protein